MKLMRRCCQENRARLPAGLLHGVVTHGRVGGEARRPAVRQRAVRRCHDILTERKVAVPVRCLCRAAPPRAPAGGERKLPEHLWPRQRIQVCAPGVHVEAPGVRLAGEVRGARRGLVGAIEGDAALHDRNGFVGVWLLHDAQAWLPVTCAEAQ